MSFPDTSYAISCNHWDWLSEELIRFEEKIIKNTSKSEFALPTEQHKFTKFVLTQEKSGKR